MIEQAMENGYKGDNASAKVCQDIVLKALATGPLSRNVTIKGGVVMRSKTNNVRRATQDLDIDFIKYSLADEAIDIFIKKLNCIEGVSVTRTGEIEELKQQDYSGKRVFILIEDKEGNQVRSKIDLGVHNRFELEQEEYCFDIAYDDEGASLLINSDEQMLAEKLRSLEMFSMIERLGLTGLSAPVEKTCSLKSVKPCELKDITSEKIYINSHRSTRFLHFHHMIKSNACLQTL